MLLTQLFGEPMHEMAGLRKFYITFILMPVANKPLGFAA
jgi:hypothetical protein